MLTDIAGNAYVSLISLYFRARLSTSSRCLWHGASHHVSGGGGAGIRARLSMSDRCPWDRAIYHDPGGGKAGIRALAHFQEGDLNGVSTLTFAA